MYRAADADATGPNPWATPAPPVAAVLPGLRGRGLIAWLGPLVSLAIFVAVLNELRGLDVRQIWAVVPRTPLFWLVFALSYLVIPASDWVIFRRLWRIPAAGFGALLRKLVGNELLIGYIGEVYFYTWARRRSGLSGAPFGAVKDVAILSALAGNAVTLAMMAVALPFAGELGLGFGLKGEALATSLVVLVAMPLIALAFRRRLFSLPRPLLGFVLSIHFARILLGTALTALLWHLALPGVRPDLLLLLATLRLLVSRLPLLPNKELVFAGLAVAVVGRDIEVGALMTMMATTILATHVLVGAGLIGASAIDRWRHA